MAVDCDRTLDTKLMQATAGLLKRWVRDGALPANQQTEAAMAVMALDQALARRHLPPTFAPALAEREAQVEAGLRGLFKLDGQASAASAAVGTRLAAAIEEAAGKGALRADNEAQSAALLRRFLVEWYEPTDPEIEEGIRPIFRPFTVSAEEPDPLVITADRLQAWCDRRFPERNLRIDKVDILRGGYSKGTYIVSATEEGQAIRFVLRQDKPGLPTGSSVAGEFAALETIFPRCPLAPRPLWVEADPAVFGAAVMAVDFREGEPGRVLPTEPDRRRSWALETAGLFGSLHSIRPDQPGDVRPFMAQTLDRFRQWHRRAEHGAHPGIAFGLAWLEAHLDDLAGRPVCRTHGDLAYHNILMKDDKVVAALDWEFTQFSDPVEDLAYIRPFLAEMGEWEAFLAEWQAITGLAWDDRAARWFKVFGSVRITLCNLSILHLLLTSELNDIALLVAGAKLLQKWEIDLLDAVIQGGGG